ncbi:MAG: nuclear transport factor 2 family protein [Planctomycetota bacterium]|nr:nuclear transport factor 2 family protein [Planctomycetota bacterium]
MKFPIPRGPAGPDERLAAIHRSLLLAVLAGSPLSLLSSLSGCAVASPMPRVDAGRLATDYVRALNRIGTAGPRGDDFLELWADDFEHTVSQATIRRKEDLVTFLEGWSELFTGWEYVEKRRVVDGRTVAWEGEARGVHRTSGRLLTLPLAMILEFDPDGKTRRVHVYFDTGVIARQLAVD